MQTALEWSAETYYYEGEVRVTYEPIPTPDTPTVTCDCTAEPDTITFADKDIPVTATLTAELAGKGTKTVKNWTVYGRATDGSQYTTSTVGYGLDKITQKFNFTISKSKLDGADTYIETWVMRARINFTDGTTAEQPIECSTTVVRPGTSTPDPGGTPTPPPAPPVTADIEFIPNTIINGEQSTLNNNSDGYTSMSWTFSSNLQEVITDSSQYRYPDVKFDKPGFYTAKITVSNGTETRQDTATLQVIDPKPVAVVTGPSKVIQGRDFANVFHLLNSYTPLASRGITIDFSKNQMRYKKVGEAGYTDGWPAKGPANLGNYSIEGKVFDSQGRESEWGKHLLEVVPDQPPIVNLMAPEQTYRFNESMIFIDAESVDGDTITDMQLEERYDHDNDGNYEEEPWTIIYSGAYQDTYPITYTTVGKRQYRAKVIEDYGLSADSGVAATNVLNYAPYVDFDVSGLTQQPEQGGDSQPEDLAYTGESIMRSWKLIKPYSLDANNSTGWQASNASLLTKKAIYADFFINFPNMGLGSNGRSKYNLASDITPLNPWLLTSGTIIPRLYGGHRIYTLEGNSSYAGPAGTAFAIEREANTGTELRRFSMPFEENYLYLGVDKSENFYFQKTDLTGIDITRFNNQGDVTGQYKLPVTDPIASVQYFEVTENGKSIYLAYVTRPDNRTSIQVNVAKIDTVSNSVAWNLSREKEAYIPTFLQRFRGTIDSDGDFYMTYIAETTWDGSNDYLIAVDSDKALLSSMRVGYSKGEDSFVTASDDWVNTYDPNTHYKYLYFNRGDYYAGSTTTMSVGFQVVRFDQTHGTLTNTGGGSLENWQDCGMYCGKFSYKSIEGVGTPLVRTDGSVFTAGTYNTKSRIYDKAGNNYSINDGTGQQTTVTNYKTFGTPDGKMIVPGLYVADNYPTQNVMANITIAEGTSTRKFVSKTLSNGMPQMSTTKDFNQSSQIMPDGSIYFFTPYSNADKGYYVFPFVPANGGSGFPKKVDDNTVEIIDSSWAGLWYDPAVKLKNDRLSFNVAVNDVANDKPVGAAIHIQDGKNMYAAEWTKDKLILFKVVAGTKTILQSVNYPRSPFITYPFELEASNGTLRVSINHAELIEISDKTYGKGSVGLMSIGQQQAKFSDVKVKNYGDYYIEETHQSVLVGEAIKYDKLFDDIEKDLEAEEEWGYEHDPDYFSNSLGLSEYDGESFDEALSSLDKPGLYDISFKAKDNPGMEEYEQWSEPVTKQLYVHRRPVAEPDVRFTGIVYPEGETLDYSTYDTSYDPDIPDYLADRKFRTRWADEAAWTAGERELYTRPGVELIIQEQVQDGFGVWSYWVETRVYKDALPQANQHRPQMNITYPSGTLTSPTLLASEPTLRWTYSDEDHDPQEQFYLKVSYVDNGAAIMEGTYPGDDTSFVLDENIQQGRKVKVQGRVYSKGYWSDDSNIVYFILNTPPVTHLLTFNGPKASEPMYTNNNRPLLKVAVSDVDGQLVSRVDYEIFYNPTGDLVIDTNNAISATAYTPSALQEGLHNWRARANDAMAWGGYSENGYFFVDTVPPDDTEERLDIKPNSVKVMFNPFSDTAPSSGHATRAFYMQKVNDDGSTINIDLNNNGTAEYSIPLSNGSTSYTVEGLVTGAKYRLMVVDWDVAGNMGEYQYIYFTTNRPPAADFDWSPKPVYEGDTVAFTSLATDPDNNDLAVSYKLTSPSGVIRNFSYTFNVPYPTTGPSYRMTETGDWTMQLTVSDGMETVQTEKTIKVLALGLTGYVKHTEQWDEHRKEFNLEKSGREDSPRGYNVFWAGEKFLLSATTTNTGTATKADRVEVAMKNNSATLASTNTSRSNWQGELWEASFSELRKGPLTFEFTAYYNNGVVKRDSVTVQIEGNVYDIVGVHRLK
ncbi:hypothetical protein [Paenibacillus glycanilyticus]|uniref:PKD/Chitinase domain-containing protein n=1 Tax=Paenibacillus glycanilyticus TaxID=126569 RepID=A0ABQ6G5G2_9BACL|nr:hypothetical protein [Paenibacillus glycanilyticus]GLX66204.1 hypothetical protein MU1_05480 [Paenibacillus glycanilyticus]